MLPTGLDYLATFLAVQMTGAIPVPIYPPARLGQLEDHVRRHSGILANAQARMLVTFAPALAVSRLLTAQVPGLGSVVEIAELDRAGRHRERPGLDESSTAFLQYTSGSTGNPKGVVLSHGDVLASLRSMAVALGATPRDVFVSWLPLYHDMGLIGAWMGSLYYGFPLVLMSPLDFLARPARWLEAIHRHGGTLSGGPNFAYELCARRIEPEQLDGLDLSSWRLAFNGAEPVNPDTMDRFASKFAPCGYRGDAMTPVYGLAEATLGVAFTPAGRGPRVETVDGDAIANRAQAVPRSDGATGAGSPVRLLRTSDPGLRSARRRRPRDRDRRTHGGSGSVPRAVHHFGVLPQPRGEPRAVRRRLAALGRPGLRGGRRALHHGSGQGPHRPRRSEPLSL